MPQKNSISSNILFFLLVTAFLCGCSFHGDPSDLRKDMIDGPETISLHTEVPFRLFCLSSDARRDLRIRIDRVYPFVSRQRQAILEGTNTAGSHAYNLMFLYLSNIAMDYVISGKTPTGIWIREGRGDAKGNAECHEWFIETSD